MDDIAISVRGVSKTFKLPHEKNNSIKSAIVNVARRKRGFEKQQVLRDVSIDIKKGEFFGIVGRNGSGKSTLLKVISQIYSPDSGAVVVNGRLTPFIELGVGFNPELTGKDNVYLNGALLGFSRLEMNEMYDEIVAFAELERFMDQKLKNYSSGMQVRLAFSIAIRAKSDILVLDEVLAVGDAAFQQKCTDYFEKVKHSNQTVILVTHAMENVKRFCDRAMLIEDSVVKVVGDPDEIANQYTLDNMEAESKTGNGSESENKKLGAIIDKLDIIPQPQMLVDNNTDFEFDISYELKKRKDIYIGISLLCKGLSIMEDSTRDLPISQVAGKVHTIHYKIPLKYYNAGRYRVDVAVFDSKTKNLIGFNSDSCNFVIKDTKLNKGGIVSTRGEWMV